MGKLAGNSQSPARLVLVGLFCFCETAIGVLTMFTVYSTDGATKFNHGDCKRYIQAASLARIVRRTFPDRIVLVDIPVNYRPR